MTTALQSPSCNFFRSAAWAETIEGKPEGIARVRPVCKHCLLVIMFGFHQPYETQSSSHPGPEMEKGRSGERQRVFPPEPALTGPTMEVSSLNESRCSPTQQVMMLCLLAQLRSFPPGAGQAGRWVCGSFRGHILLALCHFLMELAERGRASFLRSHCTLESLGNQFLIFMCVFINFNLNQNFCYAMSCKAL